MKKNTHSSFSQVDRKKIRHSLKNHLSVIIAFAQLLDRELPNMSAERSREMIHTIEQRAKKMVEEVDLSLADEASSE